MMLLMMKSWSTVVGSWKVEFTDDDDDDDDVDDDVVDVVFQEHWSPAPHTPWSLPASERARGLGRPRCPGPRPAPASTECRQATPRSTRPSPTPRILPAPGPVSPCAIHDCVRY